MLENMIRGGGFSVFQKRYFRANNTCLDTFIPDKLQNFGVLVDGNNFQGGIMEKFSLPLNNFKLAGDLNLQDVLNNPDDSTDDYIFEVDLQYPEYLRDAQTDLPIAPIKELISKNLSDW